MQMVIRNRWLKARPVQASRAILTPNLMISLPLNFPAVFDDVYSDPPRPLFALGHLTFNDLRLALPA